MTYTQLVDFFGGLSKAAEALGIDDRRTVHAWSTRRIPSNWQIKAEALSHGKLKADADAKRETAEIAKDFAKAQDARAA